MADGNRVERGRSGRGRKAVHLLAALSTALAPGAGGAQTLPTGGNVVAGSATISQPGPTRLDVTQHSDRAVINWDSFSIGAGSRTDIRQPAAGSISVQQVVGPTPSQIFGALTSNGRVVVANPNGVWFGPGAHVDVAGIAATTATMSRGSIDRFMNGGRLEFDQPGRPDAAVVNDGTISVADHGLAALVAPGVANSGLIVARLGRVELASETRFTLDLNGDGLVELVVGDAVLAGALRVDGRPLGAAVANDGRIVAEGGIVLLRAEAVKALVDNVIDMSGVIEARTAELVGGGIILSGGDGAVRVAGTLDATGAGTQQSGGTVTVLGGAVTLADGARADVSGGAGGGTVLIGGGAHGAGAGPRARSTTVAAGATIAADALQRGDGGTAVVWADGLTEFAGGISARGGAAGGDGGFVETSGKDRLRVAESARVDTTAPRGKTGDWLLDPRNITVAFAGAAGLADVGAFATSASTDVTISAATINAAAANVTLQANTDITVNAPITLANGVDLTMNAGRSIALNQNVTTNGGDFTATVNDAGASAPDRIAGQAAFTMQSGRTISTGGGGVSITTGSFGGGGAVFVGDMTIRTINSGGGPVAIANAVGDVKGNPDISAGAGSIAIGGHNLQLGDLATTGTVTLTGTGSGDVTGNGAISAGTLTLSGASTSYDLGNEDNTVGHLTGTVADLDFLGLPGFNVAGLTATGAGGISFTTDGTVTQSAAISATADTLTLNGGAGTYILDNTGNTVQHVAGTAGSVTFYGSGGYDVAALTAFNDLTLSGDGAVTQSGAITAPGLLLRGTANFDFSTDINNSVTTVAGDGSGGVKLTNSGALAVGTVLGVSGVSAASAELRTLAGDLTLDQTVTASGAGTAIVIAPAEDFVNAVGASALSAANGRWLVYTGSKAGATFGNLDSGNTAIWNATYDTQAPGAVTQTGNRYLINSQPTVAFAAADLSKTYGDDGSAALQSSYTISGLEAGVANVYRGDTAATSYSGSPVLTSAGTATTADVAGAAYGIAIAQGTVAGVNGYAIGSFTSTAGLTVTPKPLTPALTGSVTKVYDGNASATLAAGNYSLPGVLAGDTVALNNPTSGSYDNKSAGAGKTVSAGGLALSGADSGNYTLASVTASGAVGTITPAPLTVSGITANDKVYDRTTTATLATGGAAFTGVVAGDIVALDASGYAAGFADRNAGAGKAVTVTGLGLSGADGGNYTLTQPAGLTASITQAPLTVSGVTANDRVYDTTTVATLTTGGAALSGVIGGDTVGLDVSGYAAGFADKHVGAAKTVTVSGMALTGGDASNYALSQPAGLTATITPVPVTVSGVTANSRVYDATTTATLSTGGATLSGVLGGDIVALDASGYAANFANKSVGAGKAVVVTALGLSGADGGNYTLAQPAGLTATITPAPVTLSGVVANDKTYDRTTAATLGTGGATVSGVVPGDVVSLDASGYAAAFADRNAGTGKTVTVTGLALSGADGGNYTLSQPAGLTAAINQAPLTVTGVTANNKTYDATATASLATGGAALSGVIGGDTVSLDIGGHAASFADKNAGAGKAVSVTGMTLAGADSGNYALSQPAGLTATITPAPLTVTGVTADDKIYDRSTRASIATGAASFAGLIGGDVVSLDTSGQTASFADKNVGTDKAVTVSGLGLSGPDGGNYTLAQPAGLTADITPAPLTVTGVTVNDKVYDRSTAATATAGGAALAGVIVGDAVVLDSSGVSASFADKNVGVGKAVTVTGLLLSGADGGNYVLSQPAGLTATITAAPLTVSGVTANDRVYDATTQATLSTGGASLLGVLPGDNVGVGADGYTARFADKNVGTGKAVTVTGLVLSGADGGNYVLSQPGGLTATITPAPVSVAGLTAADKVYDAGTSASLSTSGASVSGAFAGDAVGIDAGSVSGSFADKTVGAGKAVTVTGLVLTGADRSNYVLTQPDGLNASITPATVTASGVTAYDKVYDATTSATLSTSGAVLSGVLGSDVVSLYDQSYFADFADKNVGTAKAVTVTGLVLAGADAGNYVMVQPSGLAASITPAPLTIAADDASKAVGAPMPPFTATFIGLKGSDDESVVTGLRLTTLASETSAAGTYAITPGGATAANYTISYVDGKLTVTAVPVGGLDPVPASLQAGFPLDAIGAAGSATSPLLGIGAGAVPRAGGTDATGALLAGWISPFGETYASQQASSFANGLLDGSESLPAAPAALQCARRSDATQDQEECLSVAD